MAAAAPTTQGSLERFASKGRGAGTRIADGGVDRAMSPPERDEGAPASSSPGERQDCTAPSRPSPSASGAGTETAMASGTGAGPADDPEVVSCRPRGERSSASM